MIRADLSRVARLSEVISTAYVQSTDGPVEDKTEPRTKQSFSDSCLGKPKAERALHRSTTTKADRVGLAREHAIGRVQDFHSWHRLPLLRSPGDIPLATKLWGRSSRPRGTCIRPLSERPGRVHVGDARAHVCRPGCRPRTGNFTGRVQRDARPSKLPRTRVFAGCGSATGTASSGALLDRSGRPGVEWCPVRENAWRWT